MPQTPSPSTNEGTGQLSQGVMVTDPLPFQTFHRPPRKSVPLSDSSFKRRFRGFSTVSRRIKQRRGSKPLLLAINLIKSLRIVRITEIERGNLATTGSSSTVARDWKSIDNFSAARSRQRKSGSIPRLAGKGEKRGSEISSVEDRGGDIARIVAKIEGGMNRGEGGPALTKDRRGTAYRANETSGRGRRDFLLERRRVASTSGRGNYFNVGRVGRGIQCVGGPARSSLRPRNFDPRRGSLHRPRRSNVEGTTTARARARATRVCMHVHMPPGLCLAQPPPLYRCTVLCT